MSEIATTEQSRETFSKSETRSTWLDNQETAAAGTKALWKQDRTVLRPALPQPNPATEIVTLVVSSSTLLPEHVIFFMSPLTCFSWTNGFTSGKMGASRPHQMKQKPRWYQTKSWLHYWLHLAVFQHSKSPSNSSTRNHAHQYQHSPQVGFVNHLQTSTTKHLQEQAVCSKLNIQNSDEMDDPHCVPVLAKHLPRFQTSQFASKETEEVRCWDATWHWPWMWNRVKGDSPEGLDLGWMWVGCRKTNPEWCSSSWGDPPRHLPTHRTQYETRHHPRVGVKNYHVDEVPEDGQSSPWRLLSPLGLWPNTMLLQPFWLPPLPASLDIPTPVDPSSSKHWDQSSQ